MFTIEAETTQILMKSDLTHFKKISQNKIAHIRKITFQSTNKNVDQEMQFEVQNIKFMIVSKAILELVHNNRLYADE